MKIRKSTVVAHIGKLSVQVPDLTLDMGAEGRLTLRSSIPPANENLNADPNFGIGPRDEILDLPDDYFMRVRNNLLTVGREQGFLFISPKGYEALKPMLRDVFTALEQLPDAQFRARGTWTDFERAVEKFHVDVKQATRKRAVMLQRKAGEVNQACSAVFDDDDNPADGYA